MNFFRFTKGSILSFSLAMCYCVGILLLFTLFQPLIDVSLSAKQHFNYILNHKIGLQFWYLVIYVVFGLILIPFTLIIKNVFNNTKESQLVTVFGYIWAAFVLASGFIFIVSLEKINTLPISEASKLNIWYTIELMQEALGGGTELIGGVWVLIIGVLGIKKGKFNRFFNSLTIVLGVVGVLSIFPFLMNLGGVFGLLQIVWFVILGFILRKRSTIKQV